MNRIELLAPAGDLEKLKVAVLYGANAVFVGGKNFSLRSRASNFTIENLKEASSFCHEHNAKLHVTCNIVMHENDTKDLLNYLKELEEANVDAIITSSLYMAKLIKENTKMEAHISTQESTLNKEALKFYEELKVDRVVLGRELSILELAEIRKHTNLDLEVFIHGGMCASYSGRCMLSNNMTNRDANRGGCAHSCRWNYDLLIDDKKINNETNYFSLSSKDLNGISEVSKLVDLKINSLKIEGRMKSLHYVASITNAYRKLLDEYETTNMIKDLSIYENMINKAENRLTSTGFLTGDIEDKMQLYDLNLSLPTQTFIGIVKAYDKELKMVYVEQRNFFKAFSEVEVFSPQKTFKIKINEIYDKDNNEISYCPHPLEIVHFKCDIELFPYDMLRLC